MISNELSREFEAQMRALNIGKTPLRRLQKMERRLGVRRLHAKLEGENPTGTHKDRMALLMALDALRNDRDTLAAATSGNYGAALMYVSDKLGLRCKIYMASEYEGIRNAEILSSGADIVPVGGTYEEAVRTCARDCRTRGWHDCNPGAENRELGIFSYTFIAKEIADALGRKPDWVGVPVGNGTVLAGVWKGFRSIGMKPHMLGTSNNNAAIRGMVTRKFAPVPVPNIEVTRVNCPLAGNYLPDAEEAIRAMVESNGVGMEITDEEMVDTAKAVLEEERLSILPASAGALAGMSRLETKTHTFVTVATARGPLCPG
ncbi:MAG: pyridoxal-phosphate dependent enzyme [Methanobacteriota archaeon]|nr:MAG: pyridoxal-phosphate dependent enzyme [Euryarchaeota archaeon]